MEWFISWWRREQWILTKHGELNSQRLPWFLSVQDVILVYLPSYCKILKVPMFIAGMQSGQEYDPFISNSMVK